MAWSEKVGYLQTMLVKDTNFETGTNPFIAEKQEASIF